MLYLASKSPRRRDLLRQTGVAFDTLAVDIDETWDGREDAGDFVGRLALEKARAGRRLCGPGTRVLAADTEVVLDRRVLGKPADFDTAAGMLRSLSGRSHEVWSAVALVGEAEVLRVGFSRVTFRELGAEEIRIYCESGEPFDKAGGYGIQGRAAAFVSALDGSYSAVMGLPLAATRELLGHGAGAA